MPSAASQVEVQAPPGLEALQQLPQHADSAKYEQELKEKLFNEVTAAVKDHIEKKTDAAVESLWLKGQKAMQYMQQQHAAQTEELQRQLAACAESYQTLQHENQILRSGLEALMKHLTTLFGTPPHAPPVPQTPVAEGSPFFPQVNPAAQAAAAGANDSEGDSTTSSSQSTMTPQAENQLAAPSRSIPTEAASLALQAASASSEGGTGAEPLPDPVSREDPASAQPATTFQLTLRRADTVPVGLDVQGEENFLLVERVRPGGAVEAWNRQCPGDVREIREGDRIIAINGSQDPEQMRAECLTKHLLKITVVRPPSSFALRAAHLRADADEFVPQVS